MYVSLCIKTTYEFIFWRMRYQVNRFFVILTDFKNGSHFKIQKTKYSHLIFCMYVSYNTVNGRWKGNTIGFRYTSQNPLKSNNKCIVIEVLVLVVLYYYLWFGLHIIMCVYERILLFIHYPDFWELETGTASLCLWGLSIYFYWTVSSGCMLTMQVFFTVTSGFSCQLHGLRLRF